VATVVVTDDPDVAAPATDQLRHLDVPGIFVHSKAVEKYDRMVSGVRSPVTNGQRDAIARGDYAVTGQRSACAGHSPTAASRWRRLWRQRFVTRHGGISGGEDSSRPVFEELRSLCVSRWLPSFCKVARFVEVACGAGCRRRSETAAVPAKGSSMPRKAAPTARPMSCCRLDFHRQIVGYPVWFAVQSPSRTASAEQLY